jgi:hypothetical protein
MLIDKLIPKALCSIAILCLTGCVATAPTLGEDKGTVSGAAGGDVAVNQNKQLEKCTETLGTLAIEEDVNAPWYLQLRQHQLGSTMPVLRLMIQQSNCFVIVDRGRAMNNMMAERSLQQTGEMRDGSHFGKGQMVAADYTLSPSIQFAEQTSKAGGAMGGGALGLIGAIAAGVSTNQAATTLLLIDNRSGVQISAAEGTAKNMDFMGMGALFGGSAGASAGGYANTPKGKLIVAAFADSFNQMIKALRNYKAQTVQGGLGAGGRLGVDGGHRPASTQGVSTPAVVAPEVTAPAKKKRRP